jgi:hypothetical protein
MVVTDVNLTVPSFQYSHLRCINYHEHITFEL